MEAKELYEKRKKQGICVYCEKEKAYVFSAVRKRL